MPFYSSVKYYDKYRTRNHFIAMIRTPLLNLLYKKQNKTLKTNPPQKQKTQNNKKTKPQTPEIYILSWCKAAQHL